MKNSNLKCQKFKATITYISHIQCFQKEKQMFYSQRQNEKIENVKKEEEEAKKI